MIKTKSPWFWVPTLYFAQGIPYFIVNNAISPLGTPILVNIITEMLFTMK